MLEAAMGKRGLTHRRGDSDRTEVGPSARLSRDLGARRGGPSTGQLAQHLVDEAGGERVAPSESHKAQ